MGDSRGGKPWLLPRFTSAPGPLATTIWNAVYPAARPQIAATELSFIKSFKQQELLLQKQVADLEADLEKLPRPLAPPPRPKS